MANTLYPQLQSFTLYSSGATVGDTSLVLSTMKDIDGTQLAMANFGDKGFLTLDPGAGTSEEQVSFSGITANANGTTTLTGVKTVLCLSPYTETSGIAKSHSGGSTVVAAITSGLLNQFSNKGNTETITGTWTFPNGATTPLLGTSYVAPTISWQVASKGYVDSVAIAGAPDANTTVKGIVEIATGAELAAGTGTGGTGAAVVPAGSSFTNTSAGAGDVNKVAVLGADGTIAQGFLDSARTIGAVYSFTANNAQITTDPDSANDAVRKSYSDSYADAKALLEATTLRFGDSSDGAFAETSGTTTWNTASKTVYQFSSFSLTGTASVALGSNLQNKRVFVLVNGNLTVTSATVPAIDGRYRGASGATGAISLSAQSAAAGTGIQKIASSGGLGGSASTDPATFSGPGGGGGASCVTAGSVGGNGAGGTGMVAGAAGGTGLLAGAASTSPLTINHWLSILSCGDGGGAGCGSTSGSRAGGSGGAGGGCIIFIVKGAINITSTFNVAGETGANGLANGTNYYSGGGGGGGGGSIAIFYTGAVTANTATLTVSGGSGGATLYGGAGGGGGGGGTGIALVKALQTSILNGLAN